MSEIPLRVLVVEDNPADVQLTLHELRQAGFTPLPTHVETEADFLARLDPAPDIVLCDYNLPQFDAMRALELLRAHRPDIPFLIVSGSIGEETAVEAIKRGATDYLLKDRLGRLGPAVKQALEQRKLRDAERRAHEALRKSEEQYRLAAERLAQDALLLSSVRDSVVVTDPGGIITYWNAGAARLFGWTAEVMIGRPYADRFPERIRKEAAGQLLERAAAGEWQGESEEYRKDGTLVWIHARVSRITDAANRTTGIMSVSHDITNRKRAEAERNRLLDQLRLQIELLQEQSHLAALSADVGLALTRNDSLRDMLTQCTDSMVQNLDAAFARIWTLNEPQRMLELQSSSGIYTHIDGPHARVPVGKFKIGLIAEEKLPHLTNDVLHDPRVSDHDWAQCEGMVAFAGYPLMLEDRLVGVMAMFSRKPFNQSALDAMFAVANQIALGISRKQSDESLRETYNKLQSLIHASPLAIIALDEESTTLQWNRAAERIFGWSESEVLGKPYPLVPEQQRAEFTKAFREDLIGANRVGVEIQRVRKDGSLIDVALWTSPLHNAQGKIVASLELFADMTDKKRLEQQFRQSQKMEAVGRLAGGIAHDFNNLLTVINGYAEMLLGELAADDPNREVIEEIHRSGERAATLTRQLLAFSRRQVLIPVVLDLNVHLDELEKLLRRLIGADIDLRIRKAPELWRVESDPGQIEQVVMNLVINARDALPHGGKLTIQTSNVELDDSCVAVHSEITAGEYVLLAVEDSGEGMDQATQSKIFEPFFTTKEQGKGTGLGLATVYGIVRQSGGHIEVYSELGIGTSFKIYLPRSLSEKVPRPLKKPMSIEAGGTETILLVEDEPGVRSKTKTILEDRGYVVLSAEDAKTAIQLNAQSQRAIDLLLTDVVLPDMNGSELREQIAAVRPEIKVLFFSGYTDEAVVHHGLLGLDAPFLQKPFKPSDLARKVREALDAGKR